jgi:hypothetical protein
MLKEKRIISTKSIFVSSTHPDQEMQLRLQVCLHLEVQNKTKRYGAVNFRKSNGHPKWKGT